MLELFPSPRVLHGFTNSLVHLRPLEFAPDIRLEHLVTKRSNAVTRSWAFVKNTADFADEIISPRTCNSIVLSRSLVEVRQSVFDSRQRSELTLGSELAATPAVAAS